MSHWAEINEDGIVIQVTVGDNNDTNNDEGYQWLIDNLGGTWIKCSYNTYEGKHKLDGVPFRKNFPSAGFYYDESRDAFIPPKPESNPSFILDEDSCTWVHPVSPPLDGNIYYWDESLVEWLEV